MEDPKVTIGDHEFTVPEFTIKAQRVVTPALARLLKILPEIEDDEKFGLVMDTIFLCLTVDGANKISKEEFEGIRAKAIEMYQAVVPVFLRQAGLQPDEKAVRGGAGAAGPDTPLSGETTSTT